MRHQWTRSDGQGVWCELAWDGYDRRIHVLVDWEYLTAAQARELGHALSDAAGDLEREADVGGKEGGD
jgi:hypothetical protein